MAKHISKSVIEGIAYEFKNSGLYIEATKRTKGSGEEPDCDYTDANTTLDSLIQMVGDLIAEHDPTFSRELWNKQTEYRVE